MPKVQESAIHSLRPTQLTVGMIEVQDKKTHLASLKAQDQQDFMQAHPMPAVIGPGGNLYITDHHHLGRAALEAGATNGFFLVEADLSARSLDDFWKEMDRNLWVHPLDENGVRHYYAAIPQRLDKLVDGRVEMWRGSSRFGLSVAAPFVWRCPSNLAVTPFPHPPHQTGQADFPHPAFGQDFMLSPTESRVCQ